MLHLHLFDGDGAGAEAGASEGGAETSTEPTVVYGKTEEDGTEGQNGTDEGDGDEGEPEDLGAEFEELINGKFKAQFGNRVNSIIQNRFKNAENYQEQVSEWQEATAMLAAKYGIDAGDPAALRKAIEADDGLFSHEAEKEGLTADRYRENLKLRLEAAKGRTLQEEMQRERERRAAFARWDEEAANLKEVFPAFELDKELGNDVFVESLNRGNSVSQSFYIAHMDEILSGSMNAAENKATQQTVENFKTRAARPVENGVTHQPATIRKDDPSKFTDKELEEVAERARRGETIRF